MVIVSVSEIAFSKIVISFNFSPISMGLLLINKDVIKTLGD